MGASKKVKTIKFTLLNKGETIDYQTVIEEVFGMELSKLSCYDANNNLDPKYNDGIPYGRLSNYARAYFNPDCDYEVIIRPIK